MPCRTQPAARHGPHSRPIAGKTLLVYNPVQSAMLRVTAGQSSSSYLYQKIVDAQVAAGGSGDRMPPPPRNALDSEEIEIIRVWIDEGALSN